MKYRLSWFGVLLLCGITLLLGIELISCQKDKAEIDISSDTETPGGEMEIQSGSFDIIDDPEVKPAVNIPAMISLADNEVTVTVVHPEPTFIAEMVWNPSKARWEFCVLKPELVFIYLDGKEINLAEWMRKVVVCEMGDYGYQLDRTDRKNIYRTWDVKKKEK